MKISLVTACRNMEDWIETTFLSVNDPCGRLEYVVVDGASKDGTLSIIDKYREKFSTVISEPDKGQYFAIAKGFENSSGEIMGWINADDVLMPWSLSVISEIFEKFPEVMWISGTPSFLNRQGQLVQSQTKLASYPQKFIANGWYQKDLAGYLQQENIFWRRELWQRAGGLDLNFKRAADFDLWTRFAKFAPLVSVDVPLAAFRERPGEQVSSVFATDYECEVAKCCSKLDRASGIWRFISAQNLILQNLCRLLIWRRSTSIVYCRRACEWRKIKVFRSISRVSFADLITQFRLRREV